MKKVIMVIIMVIIMLTTACAEDCWYLKEQIMYKNVTDKYITAFEEGESISEYRDSAVLYNDIMYWKNAGILKAEDYDLKKDDTVYEMERKIEKVLIDDGVDNAKVYLQFVGNDEFGEKLYDIELITDKNLNEVSGEIIGNGYVRYNYVYHGIRGITIIEY